ncbi:MAG: histone deacetylase [Ignavibacteriaceae bacterium]|nr:histone deacetylase [Ignavibacteriaceae bacterium]
MKELAILYDEIVLTHNPPFTHAENPSRVEAILNKLRREDFLESISLIKPRLALEEEILLVHAANHLELIRTSIRDHKLMLDEDTYVTKESWIAALTAAGSLISAVDLVIEKKYRNVFCLVRPPGHHAESNRPMGFCLFNNAAIAAKYAIQKYQLERVAIIDFDVHHGNGTQEIFYESPEVYYFSLHQFPLYPGTGREDERGLKRGKNYTLNFPLAPGTDGNIYIKIFNEKIIPELAKYKPQLVVLSSGFDAHKDDPLANMLLQETDFAEITKIVRQFAQAENIGIISTLEGGYNLSALAESVYEHLKVLNT